MRLPKKNILLLALLTGLSLPVAMLSPQYTVPVAHAQQARSTYQGPPWLGFVASRDNKEAVEVASVLKESPAQKAGLAPGDIITTVDETSIKSVRDLKIILRTKVVGDSLEITYTRKNKSLSSTLTLTSTPSPKQLVSSQLMGEKAPDFAFAPITAQHGEAKSTTKLSEIEGKITIIDFWATWCKPCEPFKTQLSKVKGKYKDNLQIVALSSESTKTLAAHVKDHTTPYIVASDASEAIHDRYFVRSIPLIIILDKDHKVRKVITGDDDPALITKSIQALMAN